MEQIALIDEADQLGQGANIMGQMPFAAGPDSDKGEGVEDDEEDEGVVGGHAGCGADLVVLGEVLGGEDAAAEDGQRDGEEADG